jgi:hypothetical protein
MKMLLPHIFRAQFSPNIFQQLTALRSTPVPRPLSNLGLSNNTAARDAVKREALRRAGIGYVEVVSGDTPAIVRDKVRRLVQKAG